MMLITVTRRTRARQVFLHLGSQLCVVYQGNARREHEKITASSAARLIAVMQGRADFPSAWACVHKNDQTGTYQFVEVQHAKTE